MMDHRGLNPVSFTDLKNYIGREGVMIQNVSPLGRKGVYAIYSGVVEEAPFIPIGHKMGYSLAHPKDRGIHQLISPSDKIFVKDIV